MHETSGDQRESFLAHVQRERAFAVAMIVAANVVVTLGVLFLVYLLDAIASPPDWVDSASRGFIFGEVAWLAIWFSLSGSTLRLRAALMCTALVLFSFGDHFLVRYCAMRWGNPLTTAAFSWDDSWRMSVLELIEGSCLVLLVYAVLLPTRHLFGIAVATADLPVAAGRSRGQFQILHWMIWAAVVAAPLALTSMTNIRRDDGGLPRLILIVRVMTCIICLIFALPVFLASLRQRRAGIWTGLTLLGITITGIGGCEVARSIQPIFDWRTTLTFLAMSSVVICLNNIVLRVLGIRLRRASHVLLSGKRNGE